MAPDLLAAVNDAMRAGGVDLGQLGRAWARATPLVLLVPAFGLRALPTAARVVLGLAFGATILPALTAPFSETPAEVTALTLVDEVFRGLPIAIATAVPLWAATMAGGVADALRGTHEGSPFVLVEGRPTPLAVLFSLAAGVLFFASGGPARAAHALIGAGAADTSAWLGATTQLVHGITLAVSIAAPILAASIVLEVSGALIARAASPAHVDALVGPIKAIALLIVIALGLDRMVALLR
jgi:type III secretory pathway component EscT